MSSFEIKKVENCFRGTYAFQYRFGFNVSEKFVRSFENEGDVQLKLNFPRPSYTVTLRDGTRIIGALHDVAFKVIFPPETHEKSKEEFESLLEDIAGRYSSGNEQ